MELQSVKSLVDKIQNSVTEVQHRSIKTLESKLQMKIVSVDLIANQLYYGVEIILNYINEYQNDDQQLILAIKILYYISQVPNGSQLLKSYGCIEFFIEFKQNLKENKIIQLIDDILENLVKSSQYQNYHNQTQNITDNLFKSNQQIKDSINIQSSILKVESQNNSNQNFIQTSKVQQFHINTLENTLKKETNQPQKDILILSQVNLTESDEKFFFETGVQLKFADKNQIYDLLRVDVPKLIDDFPIEAFKFKDDIVKELVIIMKKHEQNLQILSLQNLTKILDKITIKINNQHKNEFQNVNQSESTIQHLNDDLNYIKFSYPSLDSYKQSNPLGNWTLIQMINCIVHPTFELIELYLKKQLSSQVFLYVILLWKSLYGILKSLQLEFIQDFLYNYLPLIGKTFNKIQENYFYEDEAANIFLQDSLKMFLLLNPEEYNRQDKNFLINQIYQIFIRGFYKNIFSIQQIECIKNYQLVLEDSSICKHLQTQNLVESINGLLKLEEQLLIEKNTFDNQTEYLQLLEFLQTILIALPFSTNPNIIELYYKMFLLSMTQEYNEIQDKNMYQDSKDLILKILYINNKFVSQQLLQQILSSLNSNEKLLNQYPTDKISIQAFLDESFINEVIYVGLHNKDLQQLTLEIIYQYLTKTNMQKENIRSIIQFVPLVLSLSYKYTLGCSIIQLLKSKDDFQYMKIVVMNIFSKQKQNRLQSMKLVQNQRVMEALFQKQRYPEQSLESNWIFNIFQSVEQNKTNLASIIDPLEEYLDSEQKNLKYLPDCSKAICDVEVSITNLQNLFEMVKNTSLSENIRYSAIDQIGDLLQILIRSVKQNVNILQELIGFALDTLDLIGENNDLLVEKLASILNCILSTNELFLQPLQRKIRSKILNPKSNHLLSLICCISKQNNRYQSLKALNLIIFNVSDALLQLDQIDAQESDIIHEYFFYFNQITKSTFQKYEIWNSVYPLDQYAQFMVDQSLRPLIQDKQQQAQHFINLLQQEKNNYNNILDVWIKTVCFCDNQSLFDDKITDYIIKQLSGVFQKKQNLLNESLQMYYLMEDLIKNAIFRKDEALQNQTQKHFTEQIFEFIAINMISYFLEVPLDIITSKLDILIANLSLITKFLKIQNQKVTILFLRKIIKQEFFDLLLKVLQTQNTNIFFINKLCSFLGQIMNHSEFYCKINLNEIMKELIEQLTLMRCDFSFFNLKIIQKILKFILQYGRLYNISQKQNNDHQINKLSTFTQQGIIKNSTIGWISKYLESRHIILRIYAWNILSLIITPQILQIYQSLLDQSLNVIFAPNECFGVQISSMNFLSNVLYVYSNEIDIFNNEQQITIKSISNKFFSRNFIHHYKSCVKQQRTFNVACYYSQFSKLVLQLQGFEKNGVVAVLSQLELWENIVKLSSFSFYLDDPTQNIKRKITILPCRKLIETLQSMYICNQLLINSLMNQKQLTEYLLNSTDILVTSMKTIKNCLPLFKLHEIKHNFQRLQEISLLIKSVLNLLMLCLNYNSDLFVFMLNKKINSKSDPQNSYVNILGNISKLLQKCVQFEQSDSFVIEIASFIALLGSKWNQLGNIADQDISGVQFYQNQQLNIQDYVGEILLQQLSREYKKQMKSVYINGDNLVKVLKGIQSLLSLSDSAKMSCICSGFFNEILKDMIPYLDYFTQDDNKQNNLKKSNLSVSKLIKESSNDNNVLIAYLNTLKYLFLKTNRQFPQKVKLQDYLTQNNSNFFQILLKTFYLLLQKQEYAEFLSKIMCNFTENDDINLILFTKLISPKYQLLQEITNLIYNYENMNQQTFSWMISLFISLSSSYEIRAYFVKSRFFEQLNQKLILIWGNKKEKYSKNHVFYHLINVFASLSFYPDTQTKLLTDKDTLECLIDILQQSSMRGKLAQKSLTIMANCAINLKNKSHFLQQKQIYPVIMTILDEQSSDSQSLYIKMTASRFLLNFLYKSNGAIVIFNNEEVIQELTYLSKESEREIDKQQLEQTEIQYHKNIHHNLKKILDILKIQW